MRKSIQTSILVLVLALFFTGSLFSQRFQSLNNEFPFAKIREIMQDDYGFLWFSTVNGIVRYDGYNYRHYLSGNRPEDLNGKYVESLFEDSKGRIWVGLPNHGGLECFDRDTEIFRNICLVDPKTDSCYTSINIYAIKEDLDSTLWIGSNYGLLQFDPEEELVLNHFQNDPTLPHSYNDDLVLEICVDRNNTVWVSGLNGINRYNRESKSFVNPRTNSAYLAGQILDILETSDGRVLISGRHTPERIYQYVTATDSFQPVIKFDRSINNYLEFDVDSEGNGVFGTRGFDAGMFSISRQECNLYKKEESAHHGYFGERIQDVLLDKYGNAWIAGHGAFFKPASGKKIRSIRGNGHPVKAVQAIGNDVLYSLDLPYVWNHETKSSQTWWTFPPLKVIREFVTEDKHYPQLFEIQKWDENHLVMTTHRNILLYNTLTNKIQDFPQDAEGIFLDFVKGRNYDLYITDGNDYLRLFNFEDDTFTLANENPLDKIFRAPDVGLDSFGNQWYGLCDGGVYRYTEETNELAHFKLKMDTAGNKITAQILYDIYTHSSGELYFGTDNGLWNLNISTTELNHYDVEDGIQSNVIASIEEDHDGDLWLGTGTGISKFDRSSGVFRNYSSKDGFVNNTYWWDSSCKGEDGILYFGGAQGIDFFNPIEISANTIAPDLYLGKLEVNGELYNNGIAFENLQEVFLSYNENFIELELLGVHLTAPESNTYAYQINNLGWNELGTNRRLSLPNLTPGKYVITGKASNADDVWCAPKELLKIHISPPWWQTIWFYVISLMCIAVFVISLFRFRLNQAKSREKQQTDLNKRIAEVELKALQSQMNPHFLFNSLNSVKSLISKGEDALAVDYLTKFSKLIRSVLNHSRKKFVRLNDELETLSLYLELESARFGATFNYEIIVGEGVSDDFIEVPPMLIQPFVENSVWHGLLHKESGTRKLRVEILRQGELIKMIVEDNGIGRHAAKAMQTRSSSKKDSLGVKIAHERLQFLHSIYGKEAGIVIEDLKSDKGKACGTKVTISLPIPE